MDRTDLVEGRVWLRGLVGPGDLARFDALTEGDGRPGMRQADPALVALLGEGSVVGQAVGRLLPGARPVRIVSFDKRVGRNWALPWHQDRVIAVRERRDVPGFGRWSRKGDMWHCEPPVEVLARMLFVRLHLDDQDAETGAMEIALGEPGPVPVAEAAARAEALPREVCVAARGDVLVLPMLTLHRSGPSDRETPRRVLRVDYAAEGLPGGLEWALG
ncbi:phytanoyl-CoA dioxygenase [Pontivivens ytuae]|uniref:Phytanoyl-CoA dioxygenase n=1 Tax=Pontivivens ytuae TaxID=2789856 RepID=A0A7S9LPN8_9RHOB|nr:phytanoyl-CoA dioxygenase [Pontivivens ytuae]QPH52902.1 phytanoyl-CoA dioxygenase [Pontivivens ytuae]